MAYGSSNPETTCHKRVPDLPIGYTVSNNPLSQTAVNNTNSEELSKTNNNNNNLADTNDLPLPAPPNDSPGNATNINDANKPAQNRTTEVLSAQNMNTDELSKTNNNNNLADTNDLLLPAPPNDSPGIASNINDANKPAQNTNTEVSSAQNANTEELPKTNNNDNNNINDANTPTDANVAAYANRVSAPVNASKVTKSTVYKPRNPSTIVVGSNFNINSYANMLNNILDLIFVDDNLISNLTECQFPISKSVMHHVPLSLTLEFVDFVPIDRTPQNIQSFNLKNANFELLNSSISQVDWESSFSGKTAAECFDIFLLELSDVKKVEKPKEQIF
ncbi:probable serine/threonine-protein kinase dyrk1 [Rhagoletis pomonella]|uniref:probable serine/threonine-protein kinase dyrk1 n=1 Tax=Rhagoletis pomonella TaxID=28610 RepID=UPI00177E4AB8|nr:probable serine/threonine-protein kinase dyrk1 [Rhagoletis pomonella]